MGEIGTGGNLMNVLGRERASGSPYGGSGFPVDVGYREGGHDQQATKATRRAEDMFVWLMDRSGRPLR